MQINVNGAMRDVGDIDPEMPLLWALRDVMKLTGTKFGCGAALCGACTVHIDGEAQRSCSVPVGQVGTKLVTTIEGVSGKTADAVKGAWVKFDVPQCGYCQPGQIMSAIALLSQTARPSRSDVDTAMSGNVCRCGTYPRIRAAIDDATKTLG